MINLEATKIEALIAVKAPDEDIYYTELSYLPGKIVFTTLSKERKVTYVGRESDLKEDLRKIVNLTGKEAIGGIIISS